jgi:Protein of unknown function (DUF4197)
MKSILRSALLGSALALAPFSLVATTPAPVAPAPSPFSAQQLTDGLKDGLAAMISQSLASGTLTVTPPPALAKIQAAVSKTGNATAGAGFNEALAAAVAQVSPQVAGLMKGELGAVKAEDAQGVLAGGPDAATQFLQKTAGPKLREKLLPLVKQAMASSSTAAKAKEMIALGGPLAGFAGNKAVSDLDGYVCDQVLAQGFSLLAKQEAAVRANPALLTSSPLAQKVFAAFKK